MTERADQYDCTEFVVDHSPEETAYVSNLGVASRVLGQVRERTRNFYLRGGMGCTTPTGLGLALTVDSPVVVFEGDGSLLMSLGCLSTVGTYDPENLTIVVWNNAAYATTGGQASASDHVAFDRAAESCGVDGAHVSSRDAFEDAYAEALAHEGASLVACDVERADPDSPEGYRQPGVQRTYRFRQSMMGDGDADAR